MPPERALVEELGVSRAVVREALSSLEALGLVETRGRRGRFVGEEPSLTGGRSIVAEWLQQHAREILELDEIRSVLEWQAIRSLSEWDAIDAARRAAVLVREQGDAVEREDAVEAARLDRAFHSLLCSYTQNDSLRALIERLMGRSRREVLAVYSLPEAALRSLDQHRQIVAALTRSDVEQAAEIARLHMVDAARQFVTAAAADENDPSSRSSAGA